MGMQPVLSLFFAIFTRHGSAVRSPYFKTVALNPVFTYLLKSSF